MTSLLRTGDSTGNANKNMPNDVHFKSLDSKTTPFHMVQAGEGGEDRVVSILTFAGAGWVLFAKRLPVENNNFFSFFFFLCSTRELVEVRWGVPLVVNDKPRKWMATFHQRNLLWNFVEFDSRYTISGTDDVMVENTFKKLVLRDNPWLLWRYWKYKDISRFLLVQVSIFRLGQTMTNDPGILSFWNVTHWMQRKV